MQLELEERSSAEESSPVRRSASRSSSPAYRGKRRFAVGEWVRILLAAVVVPNLIVCARFTALSEFFRGWVNIEILLLIAAYLVVRSPWLLVCIGLDAVLDLFEPVAHLFYFSSMDAVHSLAYLGAQPTYRLALYGGCVAAYTVMVTLAVQWLLSHSRRLAARRWSGVVACIALVLSTIDMAGGRYRKRGPDVKHARVALVRTPGASLVSRINAPASADLHSRPTKLDSAPAHLLESSKSTILGSHANVVLVLVESWGEMWDSPARNGLEEVYRRSDLQAKYSVETGTVPFIGATISGETRALCGEAYPSGAAVSAASDAQLHACLPFLFAQYGYSTIGIHGFRPDMYGRQDWYPRVGFSQSLFGPDLRKLGLKMCDGGLRGTCDADVADLLVGVLQKSSFERPAFVHWVSLNSHLPVDPNGFGARRSNCEAISPVLKDDGLCAWYGLVKIVHNAVLRLAMTAVRPTYFVVVGDHAPPFLSSARRSQFSQERVPYVILRPRQPERISSK